MATDPSMPRRTHRSASAAALPPPAASTHAPRRAGRRRKWEIDHHPLPTAEAGEGAAPKCAISRAAEAARRTQRGPSLVRSNGEKSPVVTLGRRRSGQHTPAANQAMEAPRWSTWPSLVTGAAQGHERSPVAKLNATAPPN